MLPLTLFKESCSSPVAKSFNRLDNTTKHHLLKPVPGKISLNLRINKNNINEILYTQKNNNLNSFTNIFLHSPYRLSRLYWDIILTPIGQLNKI